MKYLLQTLLYLLLSTQVVANDKVSVDFNTIDIYESTLSKISLSIEPQKKNDFSFIFSYVSSLFSFEKTPQRYNNTEDYKQVHIALNFRF
ncbi:hypothetical protein [Sulfurimonas paralvinellae]|uniref:DUF481 domain-containing protein n=1 Tax=Sulfurimonas paralvinellae TaxID=317658 RepID=A0A7M1BB03_9BACT|nr:hypothetical protein [Sulfurimonas paralvinellae]QOP46008.1 hypothetical protein FM071_06745 [Sulfurimonas paralvinellae]